MMRKKNNASVPLVRKYLFLQPLHQLRLKLEACIWPKAKNSGIRIESSVKGNNPPIIILQAEIWRFLRMHRSSACRHEYPQVRHKFIYERVAPRIHFVVAQHGERTAGSIWPGMV